MHAQMTAVLVQTDYNIFSYTVLVCPDNQVTRNFALFKGLVHRRTETSIRVETYYLCTVTAIRSAI